ncbi:MAG: xanthine dehydrogenase family protein molybdopterin-binding subunit [Chloroflexi bacterium]|nr:MAG: xanthine dehydrogenase family protein molybdopterin-binding subunit [Chloroflexota bacterium]
MATRIDVLRVATDAEYAASLSSAEWASVAYTPEFQQMAAEQRELLAATLETHAASIPGFSQVTPPATPAQVLNGPYSVVGQKVPRVHGLGIVTGLGQYTEHMTMPGMLYTRTLRSPHPHARVKSVDTSNAEKFPGVVAVLHRGNLPDIYKDVNLGSGPPDRGLFDEELFEVGAPVAIVAAENEHTADEAIRLIDVQYEILPAALDFLEAMKSTTPHQFDTKLDGLILGVTPPLIRGNPDQKGDVNIDVVASKSFEQHLALELTNSLSWWDGDKLVMYYTSQWAHGVRANLSQALKIPANKIRVVQPGYMGSGYGYRSNADLTEVHSAILARITGRPIHTTYTRAEDFVTRTHRPQFRDEMHLSVNKDGSLVAGNFKVIANVGAARSAAANGSWFNMQDLYKIPNLKLEAIDVFTNSYKQGPYRCVSHPNGTLALEVTMEKAAYAIGMDPVQFRLNNLNETGNPDTNKPFSNPGIRDCIQQAADAIGWKQNWHPSKAKEVRPGVFHGIALSAHACSHGGGANPASGQIIVNTDGSIQCVSASNEIGDGQRTTMAMIAAESLGVPLNTVTITPYVDTELTTDALGTFGSIQTNTGGRGMYEAGQDARKQILDWGARKFVDDAKKQNQTLDIKADDVDFKNGSVFLKTDPSKKLALKDVVQFSGGPLLGRSIYSQDPKWERTAWASHAAEIEVDTVTGSINVLHYVAAHDVGRAVNPFALEQQIEGGVVMALGAALTEQLLSDSATGLPLNPNMLDYKPLSIKDAPKDIKVILVEHPKEYGVFGAHGIGEPPMAAPAPTIASAVYNAVGVWITDMPITREKVLAGLKSA